MYKIGLMGEGGGGGGLRIHSYISSTRFLICFDDDWLFFV